MRDAGVVVEGVIPPSGTLTFLLSDVVGSTRAWEDHPDAMKAALERHDSIVRGAIEAHDGYVFSTAGDAFAASFGRASDAVAAAQEAQRGLGEERWPEPVRIEVRIGVHTGEANERDGDYFGPAVNRAARIMAAGHGGQVVVSAATAALVNDVVLVDLGEHRLKDVPGALRLFQLGDDEFPALRSLAAARVNLPAERTELFGRDAEVATVADLLNKQRLVTLTGFGGIGKTRLAVAAAADVAGRFARGVHFVDLAPIDDGTMVGVIALETVGIKPPAPHGSDSIHQRTAAALSGQELLLVLDNCEHIIDDVVEFVDHVLDLAEGPVVLATSREALEIDGEHVVRVPPLAIAGDGASAATDLFLERAQAAGGHVEPSDPSVAEICHRLDGVPLAIELAAARVAVITPPELLVQLDHGLGDLSMRRRRGRHRSLEAVLQWSWDLLDDPTADLLVQLAVFSGGWTFEAARAVCDGPESVASRLNTLVACSLIEVSDTFTPTRFSMLQTVRQFALSRLDADPRAAQLRDRHLDWQVRHATARPIGEQWFSDDWGDELRVDFDNLRGAVNHALDTGRVADAATLLGASYALMQDDARPREFHQLTEMVIEASDEPSARLWLASLPNCISLGLHHLVEPRLRTALRRAIDEDDEPSTVHAATFLSSALATTRPAEATELAEMALDHGRRLGDPHLLVLTLGWSAGVAYIVGDIHRSVRLLRETEQIEIPDRSHAAAHLYRAWAFVALDHPEAGDPSRLLDIAVAGTTPGGNAHTNLTIYRAFVDARARDIDAVATTLDFAHDATQSTGNVVHVADAALAAAELLENLGRLDEAAAVIKALDRQPHVFPEIYHRRKQARRRLAVRTRPDHRLTVDELYDEVRNQLETLAG